MHWREATESGLNGLLGKRRLGLISDVDGTLSPIVARPEDARVTARNLELLAKLADELTLVALISGRGAEDVKQLVDLPGIIYVGNHGLERWKDGETTFAGEALAFKPAVLAALNELKSLKSAGINLEDKGITVSLHYRQSPTPEEFVQEQKTFLESIASKHGLTLSQGRKVFEFKPPVQLDKGSALRQLVEESNLDAVIYLGDDTTDVAALKAARKLRETGSVEAWGIGVQSDEVPTEVEATADLLASGVADVEDFLGWLLMARKASST